MNQIIKLSVLIGVLGVSYYICFKDDSPPPRMLKGYTAPGWQRVAAAFRKQIESGWQRGGALSVYYKGELVVEAYGGFADPDLELEWDQNTISQYFSSTKGIGAVVMAMLVERGLLDYTKPVSQYWPEFAQNGKEEITVETLLGHQAGLAAIDEPFHFLEVLNDDEKISRITAAQKPAWKPGSGAGYHGLTIGIYEDQLVKRVDPKGRSLAKFYQEEIAKPYDLDLYIGLPKEENYRCARCVNARIFTASDFFKYLMRPIFQMMFKRNPKSLASRVMSNPLELLNDLTKSFNRPSLREVPLASINGFGTATALAKFYGILADGGKNNKKIKPFLSDKGIKLLQEPLKNGNGTDIIFGINWALGRGVTVWKSPVETNVFGTPGAGGQIGKCDPDNKLGISYITNHLTVDRHYDDKYFELEKVIYKTMNEL